MRRRAILAVAAVLLLAPSTSGASAAGCSPGIGPACIGAVTRATQPYRFGAVRPALVKAGRPVQAGARFCLSGQSRIGRTLWFYVDRSDLMIDGATLALPTGCSLQTLDTSEPD